MATYSLLWLHAVYYDYLQSTMAIPVVYYGYLQSTVATCSLLWHNSFGLERFAAVLKTFSLAITAAKV